MGTETTADGDDDGVQSVAQLRNNSRQTSVVSVPTTTTTTTLDNSISWYTYRPLYDDNVIPYVIMFLKPHRRYLLWRHVFSGKFLDRQK